ncbi:MAG: ATP-dependent Clp protease proteolytic subunit [Candidatus Coatesbacteria bacterium]|nr:ATP-dependent Clp protease proteolytic subunit [Candidatus Coatesbacteria bacterium]
MDDLKENIEKLLVESQIDRQFLSKRTIFLWGPVYDESVAPIIKKILYFEQVDPKGEILFYINSPGGSISAGLAIYDIMQICSCPVRTVCLGIAASMGSFLLAAGKKGRRAAMSHSRILIHQPLISGAIYAPATDIQIHAEEIVFMRKELNNLLAKHTGQPIEKIEKDTDRDHFLSPSQALEYGIIDEILEKNI